MQSLYPNYQKGQDYLEQWDRVCRWYSKVKLIKENKLGSFSAEEHEDFILAYFFNVFHLKEWVKHCKNDNNFEKLFYKTSSIPCLKTLADFIINYKHFSNTNTRFDEHTWLISRDGHAGDINKPAHTWWIISDKKKINLYNLADETFNETQKYLKENNYI